MSAGTSRADLCQALLEGIALRTAEVVAAIGERVALGDRLSIDGGLARSSYFAQFLADVTGRSIVRPGLRRADRFRLRRPGGSAGSASPWRSRSTGSAVFEPRSPDAAAWRERFADAVSRARGWR